MRRFAVRATGPLSALLLAVGAFAQPPQELPHVLPRVETSRVVVEARVLDGRGRPVPGLAAADFALEVDGRPVTIESAAWVAQGAAPPTAPRSASDPAQPAAAEPPPGRRLVLFFQKDARGSRLLGLVRSTHNAARIVDLLGPRDQAAVLVHDSRLRLHLDFTADREALRQSLSGSVLQRHPAPIVSGPPRSIAAHLDPDAARDATTPEQALTALARALEPIPGEKTIVLFGWGFGDLWAGLTRVPDYGVARSALVRARATVFALDLVDADWHTLETSLEQVASDTGGLYMKTNDHPGIALERLASAISGFYVLAFERPGAARGEHRLRLSLAPGRHGSVLARGSYVD